MNNLKLQNIANVRRDLYLFLREDDGSQKIEKITDFYPFFYEMDKNGSFKGYDGVKLKKVFVSQPSDIPKLRSFSSYSADIKYTTNFIIHRINSFAKSPIKYAFIDIETLATELPQPGTAKYPVSCISIYNSLSKSIQTWYLAEQEGDTVKEKEVNLLNQFILYMQKERFDVWLSWNVSFDYNYLYFRIDKFAEKISPIGKVRMGDEKDIFYPAGLSILDYLKLFKKIFMREQSYALDNIAQSRLGEAPWPKTDFGKLNPIIKEKNINDIKRMIKIEEKYGVIEYFDELRRMVKCQWEDLYHNSRIIEMLLFDEAKKKNIILPNKQEVKEDEEASFQGATRDSEANGVFFDIGKFDLTSAYPSMIVNFCLDTQNIITDEAEFEMRGGIKVGDVYFAQNTDALLPAIVKRILVAKDTIKKLKKENPEDKTIAIKYDAIKSIVNSAFGVMGNQYFRLYDNTIASSITYLVRDLLHYVKNKIATENSIHTIYWDTDSIFLTTKENITEKLNNLVQDWAKEKGKESISLTFEYEGYFSKLFLMGKCHYVGYLDNGKKEIKGVEMKRSSSSKYEAWFQGILIDKILNKESRSSICEWIDQEKERIKTLPLLEIGFPCKLTSKEYANYPIFIRAYDNTQKLNKDFKLNSGELFYYIFIKSNRFNVDVLAFTQSESIINKDDIDWNKVIERNIMNKVNKIFTILNWLYMDSHQFTLL